MSPASTAVAESIEVVMDGLLGKETKNLFTWPVRVQVHGSATGETLIHFTINRDREDGRWKIDTTSIEAALSLWAFHIRAAEAANKKRAPKNGPPADWLRDDTEMKRIIRLLGPAHRSDDVPEDIRIRWWIGETAGEPSNDEMGFHGPVVGFVDLKSDGESQVKGNPHRSMIIIIPLLNVL